MSFPAVTFHSNLDCSSMPGLVEFATSLAVDTRAGHCALPQIISSELTILTGIEWATTLGFGGAFTVRLFAVFAVAFFAVDLFAVDFFAADFFAAGLAFGFAFRFSAKPKLKLTASKITNTRIALCICRGTDFSL
jgi:hypothetical protein